MTVPTPITILRQDAAVWELDSGSADIPAALRALCAEVGGEAITPGANCGGMFAGPRRPALPTGAGWG